MRWLKTNIIVVIVAKRKEKSLRNLSTHVSQLPYDQFRQFSIDAVCPPIFLHKEIKIVHFFTIYFGIQLFNKKIQLRQQNEDSSKRRLINAF